MSNSPLVNYVRISPYRNSPRTHKIDKITIHHMAGNLTVWQCGNVFQSSQSSTNYAVDSCGRVGQYVSEGDRSWASRNASNDNRAITIEVANDGGAPNWHVSNVAFNKLIDLCVDICKRNGIARLNYTGNANGNLTRHNMFTATTCPGPYLQSRFPEIARLVNERLNEEADDVVRWKNINDIPEGFYREQAQDFINRGIIKGKDNGDINLTEDMLRCMIFCQRIIDKK